MNASDFRQEARNKLSGKWGKAALISLAYLVIILALTFVEGLIAGLLNISTENFVFTIINFLVQVPLAFGLLIALFKVYKSEEVGTFEFFTLGFQNFKKSIIVSLYTIVKLILPYILLIVSMILIIIGMGTSLLSLAASATSADAILASANTFEASPLIIIGFILLLVSAIWATIKSYYYKLSYVVAADNPDLTATEAVNKSRELMEGKRAKLFCLELSFIGWAILAVFTFGIGMLWLAPYIQFATFAFYYFASQKSSEPVVSEEN